MTPTQLLTAQFNAKHRIAKLQRRLEKLEFSLDNFEADPSLFEHQFIDYLNEDGPVTVGDSRFYPALILKELDRAEYDNQLSQFISSLSWRDIINTDSRASALEDEINELDDRIDALKDHLINIDDMIDDIEPDAE